jgi:two-component system, NarL family, sensor histidine kinase DegS
VRQGLSDAILQAELCEAAMRSDPANALDVTGELKGRLNDALRETDILIFELEPMMLSELGLAGTLQRYVQDLITARGAPIGVRIGDPARRYHIAIERAVFRVAREALANALRHAHARHIQLALSHTTDALILSVEDDGVGFEVVPVMDRARRGFQSGLGQLCIEADLVGGLLGVKSSEGNGTRIDYIVAEVPIG